MSNSNYKDLSLIIPTINEKDNLKKLLFRLEELYPGCSFYITDDGSDDGSFEYLKTVIESGFNNNLVFLDRDNNRTLTNVDDFDHKKFISDELNIRKTRGLTASVLDALNLIETSKFAVIDADFQHPPELVGKMYANLKNDALVTAHRADLGEFPLYRKLITKTGTFLANGVLSPGNKVEDPLSGAFAGKTDPLKKYFTQVKNFKLEGFKILFDLLKIIPEDINIQQTPYSFQPRDEGQSKIGFSHLWTFYKSVINGKTGKLINGLAIFSVAMAAGLLVTFIYGDISIAASVHALMEEHPRVKNLFIMITDYGMHLYTAGFLLTIIYGIIKKKKKYLKIPLIFLVVMMAAGAITYTIKPILGRPRPTVYRDPDSEFAHDFFTSSSRYKSLPSGHTTYAFGSAGVVWSLAPTYGLPIIAFIYSLIIGISRVIVGSHFPLDVLAGMTVGFLSALFIIYKKF